MSFLKDLLFCFLEYAIWSFYFLLVSAFLWSEPLWRNYIFSTNDLLLKRTDCCFKSLNSFQKFMHFVLIINYFFVCFAINCEKICSLIFSYCHLQRPTTALRKKFSLKHFNKFSWKQDFLMKNNVSRFLCHSSTLEKYNFHSVRFSFSSTCFNWKKANKIILN